MRNDETTSPLIKLAGKTALITGASRGIGRAIALRLSEAGVKTALVGRNKNSLITVKEEIEKEGGKARIYQFDLASVSEIGGLVKRVAEDFGGIDILVNNAGLADSKPFEKTTEAEWDRIFTVNAKAPFFLCKEALPYLVKSGNAGIINITSVVAKKGYPDQSVYSASKHALYGLSKALAKELQERGIKIHTVGPGGVATEMVTRVRPDIKSDNLIQPEAIAEIVVFLLTLGGNAVVDEIDVRRAGKTPWA